MRDYAIIIQVQTDNARIASLMQLAAGELATDFEFEYGDSVKVGRTVIVPDRVVTDSEIEAEEVWDNELQAFMDAGHNENPMPENMPEV